MTASTVPFLGALAIAGLGVAGKLKLNSAILIALALVGVGFLMQSQEPGGLA